MKKFFSAILLMTMMVFSVGTFVSCNDLVEEVETIKGQTSDIEAQISALETQIAALETALKGEIKSAADLAKAEAIAAAKAECETLKALLEAGAKDLEDYIALTNAKIEAIDADLAKMATKVELEEAVKELVAKDTELSMQITALEAYKATADSNFVEIEAALAEAKAIQEQLKTYAEENFNTLYDYIGKNAGLIETAFEDIEGLKAAVEEYYTELHNLIGTNASAIGATGEALEELNTRVEENYVELYDLIGKNAGTLGVALEEIDVLKGDVKKLQDALAALEPRVKDLEEKIEKVDADLKIINTAIKDIANQIQSVVFVPATAAELNNEAIDVTQYYYGNLSTLRFLATYEVTPKALVSTLKDADLYFTNIQVKGEEPARYPAEIVSIDETTGRVTLRGKITDTKSTAYAHLAGTVTNTVSGPTFTASSSAHTVAVALHIDSKKPATIDEANYDFGTYVTDEYIKLNKVKAAACHNVAGLFNLFDTAKSQDTPQANTYTKTDILVPYNTPVANSERALFPIDVRMAIEGGYLTLAQAEEYFGIPFNVTYAVTQEAPAYKTPVRDANGNITGYNDMTDAEKALFTVTNPKSTDATVAFAKAATADDLGKYVSITVDDIKVNNLPTGLSFESQYTVDYGTTANIKFESLSADWNYKYYTTMFGNVYFNTFDNTYLQYYDAPYFNYPELDVISSPIDITKAEKIDNQRYGFSFGPNDIKAYDANGNEIKDLLAGNEYIVIESLTSKTAKLWTVLLPFDDQPVTFKANKVITNEDNNMQYSVSFDITLGATPEKQEIDLGTFEIEGKQTQTGEQAVTPIAKFKEAVGDAFGLPAISNSTVTLWNAWGTPDWLNAEATLEMWPRPSYVDSDGDGTYEEAALIADIPASNTYNETYKLEETYMFYGIKVIFTATVKYKKPEYKLVANPKFVKDGKVELTGTVTYPKYVSSGSNKGYTQEKKYALDMIDLREYVNVEGMSQDDKLKDELQIVYTVVPTIPAQSGYVEPEGVSFAQTGTAVTTTDEYAYASYMNGTNYVEAIDEIVLYWNSVKQDPADASSTINQVKVKYELESNDGKVNFGELVLTLEVPELLELKLNSKKHPIVEPYKNNNNEFTVVNIYKAIQITDTKNKYDLCNANVTGYSDLFNYNYTENGTQKVGNLNLYDIELKPDAANVKIYLKDSKTPLTINDYTFDAATGNVSLKGNAGILPENVIIEVPVYMYHMYQGDCTHSKTVTVEFTN